MLKVTQNLSFRICHIVVRWDYIVVRFWTSFLDFRLWKHRSTMRKIVVRFYADVEKQNRIFGPDLLQFYEGYFYYKYRLCIGANLEIEGAETRV